MTHGNILYKSQTRGRPNIYDVVMSKPKINYDLEPWIAEIRPDTIKVIRTGYGLTQEQLSEMSGVGIEYLRSLEQGKRHTVGVRTARKLGKALNIKFITS